MVDGAGKKFLAGSALSEQQHGGIGRRHALHLVGGFLHGLVFADDPRESVPFRVLLAEQQILAQQFLLLGRALDQKIQMLQVHGLLDEIVRAFFHRGHGFFDRAVGRDQNHGNGGIGLLGFAQHVESGAAGQFQIGENEHVAPRANLGDRGRSVRRLVHGMSGALQSLAEHRAQFGFILDQEKGFHQVCFTLTQGGPALTPEVQRCQNSTIIPRRGILDIYCPDCDCRQAAGVGGVSHPGSPPALRNASSRSEIACLSAATFGRLVVDLRLGIDQILARVILLHRRIRVAVVLLLFQIVLALQDVELMRIVRQFLVRIGECLAPVRFVFRPQAFPQRAPWPYRPQPWSGPSPGRVPGRRR